MKWISVEDALPEPEIGSIYSRDVLGYDGQSDYMFIASCVANKSWCESNTLKNIENITHWMELPKIPEVFVDKQEES